MSDDFGPEIAHDGKGCPLPVGTVVRVKLECDPGDFITVVDVVRCAGAAWFWENWLTAFSNGELCGRVVSYAIKRPDGLTILRAIAADPGAVSPDEIAPHGPAKVPA